MHTLKSYSRAKLGSAFYKALNFVDIVTVPSRVFADKLITRGVQKDKIRVIHSHIDTKNLFRRIEMHLRENMDMKRKILYSIMEQCGRRKELTILSKLSLWS